jgi:hypothetical protein
MSREIGSGVLLYKSYRFHFNPSQTIWIGVNLCAAKQSLNVDFEFLFQQGPNAPTGK